MGDTAWLARLNQRHVLRHADAVPEPFRDFVDPATYARSVQYTLAKSRLNRVELTYDSVVLLVLLFSGILPRAYDWFRGTLGSSVWANASFLFAMGFALALMSWPFEGTRNFTSSKDSASIPRPDGCGGRTA
jgi:STE24 endopeptidase